MDDNNKSKALDTNFKTATGNNFGAGEKLNHVELQNFVSSDLGYEIVGDFEDNARHVTAIVKNKETGKSYFFKVSTTEGISERQDNEIAFNEIVQQVITSGSPLSLSLRSLDIIRSGKYKDSLTFYISEQLPSEGFLNHIDTTLYPEILKKLAVINVELAKHTDLLTDKNRLELKVNGKLPEKVSDSAKRYYEKSLKFAQESGEDLAAVLELVKGYEKMDRFGLNHYDLKPDNIFVGVGEDKKIILTDGENASARTPWLFDVAHLFHKLYTKTGSSELAYTYLKNVYELLDASDKDYFKSSFTTMLATRLIGGFWEYSRGDEIWKNAQAGKQEYLQSKKLQDELLNGRIFDNV